MPSVSTTAPDMWLDPADDPRASESIPGDERTTLLDYLGAYRITLQLKCDGLSPEQLAQRSVPPSSMSLLGLVRHMAAVEQTWFRVRMAGVEQPRHYRTDQDRDLDFNGARPDDSVVQEAFSTLRAEIAFAEAFVAGEPDLGRVYGYGGEQVNLREVLVHMIEEYARHCGHADLLRECVDGRTGF